MKLFGFNFSRVEQTPPENRPTFVPKENDDGAVVVAAAGAFGTYVDLDGTVRTEAEMISKYRSMAENAEVDQAVNEIVNEIVEIAEEDSVKVVLDKIEATDPVKEAITKCFEETLDLLNFNKNAYSIIRRWYIDGRLNYHVVIDQKNTKQGILELRYVDPRKIRKIREVVRKPPGPQISQTGIEGGIIQVKNEYFLYNEKGFNHTVAIANPNAATATGIRIAKDSIISLNSGLTDVNGTMVLSYLQKAIKPLNQLRAIEDASVIYRLARAPERRVWYIDVGTLPRMKAEQYVQSIMNKHKNRLNYDANTGEYRDERKFLTMLEDYWLPRREGGKTTEVQTLPAGENLGEMDDVLYFQKKLYTSLNVPISRLNTDSLFSIGRATEITRDEVSFGKFIARLRIQFSDLFSQIMEKQVVLKEVMSVEDWKKIAPKIKYDFAHDNYFMEMKDIEVQTARAGLMEQMSQWVGRYYSNDWVDRRIWRKTDEEIEEQKELILEEETDPIYSQPMPGQGGGFGDDMGMDGMGPDEMAGGMDVGQGGFQPNENPVDDEEPAEGVKISPKDREDRTKEPKIQQRRDFKRKKYAK